MPTFLRFFNCRKVPHIYLKISKFSCLKRIKKVELKIKNWVLFFFVMNASGISKQFFLYRSDISFSFFFRGWKKILRGEKKASFHILLIRLYNSQNFWNQPNLRLSPLTPHFMTYQPLPNEKSQQKKKLYPCPPFIMISYWMSCKCASPLILWDLMFQDKRLFQQIKKV